MKKEKWIDKTNKTMSGQIHFCIRDRNCARDSSANGKRKAKKNSRRGKLLQMPAALAHISLVRRSGRRGIEVVVQTVEIVRHVSRLKRTTQKMDLRGEGGDGSRGNFATAASFRSRVLVQTPTPELVVHACRHSSASANGIDLTAWIPVIIRAFRICSI